MGGDDRCPIFLSAYKISYQFSETVRCITATVVLYESNSSRLFSAPHTKVPFVPSNVFRHAEARTTLRLFWV